MTYDATASSGYQEDTDVFEYDHTIGFTARGVLWVVVYTTNTTPATSVTANARPLTLFNQRTNGAYTVQLWYLNNPQTGDNTITVTAGGSQLFGCVNSVSYSADASPDADTSATASGTGSGLPVQYGWTSALVPNALVLCAMFTTDESITAGTGFTARQNVVAAGVGSFFVMGKDSVINTASTGNAQINGVASGKVYASCMASFGYRSGSPGHRTPWL